MVFLKNVKDIQSRTIFFLKEPLFSVSFSAIPSAAVVPAVPAAPAAPAAPTAPAVPAVVSAVPVVPVVPAVPAIPAAAARAAKSKGAESPTGVAPAPASSSPGPLPEFLQVQVTSLIAFFPISPVFAFFFDFFLHFFFICPFNLHLSQFFSLVLIFLFLNKFLSRPFFLNFFQISSLFSKFS